MWLPCARVERMSGPSFLFDTNILPEISRKLHSIISIFPTPWNASNNIVCARHGNTHTHVPMSSSQTERKLPMNRFSSKYVRYLYICTHGMKRAFLIQLSKGRGDIQVRQKHTETHNTSKSRHSGKMKLENTLLATVKYMNCACACVRLRPALKRLLLLDGYMICACIHNLLGMFDIENADQTVPFASVAWFLVLSLCACVCVFSLFYFVLFCFASFNFVRHHLIPTWMISALEQNVLWPCVHYSLKYPFKDWRGATMGT